MKQVLLELLMITTQLHAKNVERIIMNNIPEITNPLGKHWQQPDTKNILINYKYALMDEADFNKLLEYSTTTPSGVYIGKMWKCQYRDDTWYLAWFSECEDPKFVNNNYREILIR